MTDSAALLEWYAASARTLPWRAPPGTPVPADPDWPYRVWLSEIMLQQTTVAAVVPYFTAFTARWPTVAALAAADDADVMQAWAGLGYYARARNLLACARAVVSEHGGWFPGDEATLRTLPGIGAYTAAAVAAFGFGCHAIIVDGISSASWRGCSRLPPHCRRRAPKSGTGWRRSPPTAPVILRKA